MSTESKAVFLSYASQDAEAARRICDALRASGVEVWFDQSELRGGDSWDAKIRKQIRQCALFVPVISASTQARGEGYFRREWKLAVERTHDMGDHIPFLLPVTIDGTTGKAAFVPEAFLKVQWSRVPDGEVTNTFVEQVRRLLGAPDSVGPALAPRLFTSGPKRLEGAPPSGGPTQRRFPAEIAVLAAVLVAAGLGFWYFQHSASARLPKEPGAMNQEPVAKAATLPPIPTDKSIAVLPFENMSDDKAATDFFANGIQEDVIATLFNIRDFRIASVDSVAAYRRSTKSNEEIARELSVAYLLKGSVRRSAGEIRITGRLVAAKSGEEVWLKQFNGDETTQKIFAIQSAIATEIAAALKTVLSSEEKTLISRRPTESLAAYELYLKGRPLSYTPVRAIGEMKVKYFQDAVAADPGFAAAWAELAAAHSSVYFWFIDHTPGRLALADTAIARAVLLAPDDVDVILNLGRYAYYGYRDYARASLQLDRVLRIQPNNPEALNTVGAIQRRQGKFAESTATFRRVLELDPGRTDAGTLRGNLVRARRWGEAATEINRLLALNPGDLALQFSKVTIPYFESGSTKEAEAWVAGVPAGLSGTPIVVGARKSLALWKSDYAEWRRLDHEWHYESSSISDWQPAISAAQMLASFGERDAAIARLDEIKDAFTAALAAQPDNPDRWRDLAQMDALRGHRDDALQAARKAVELVPESIDALIGPDPALAIVHAWTGDKPAAIAELKRLLVMHSGGVNVHVMRTSPAFAPLHGDPQFEALLNDPKNNAPLF